MTLIERIEAASEGSRELSDEVLIALGWWVYPDEIGLLYCPPNASPDVGHRVAPDPTRSVDDALALVPEGWAWWEVGKDCDEHSPIRHFGSRNGGCFYAKICQTWGGNPLIFHAATPALALCAAILRAKEATDG